MSDKRAGLPTGEVGEIKTWEQRCDEHPDHEGLVTTFMIQMRMQEEIDDLRTALRSQSDAADKLVEALRRIEKGRRANPRHDADESCLCVVCAEAPGNLRVIASQALTEYEGARHAG